MKKSEIIRCKDCKFNPRNPKYFYDKEKTQTYVWCTYFLDEDYCSHAKYVEDVEFFDPGEKKAKISEIRKGKELDKCCETCSWHIMQTTNYFPISSYGTMSSSAVVKVEWFCNNHESDFYHEFTESDCYCSEWKK